MKLIRIFAALTVAASVSACATTETATRNAPMESTPMAIVSAPMQVVSYTVDVPKTLRSSEANLYFPGSDIVWREDPLGDRHAQVKDIIEAGVDKALAGLPEGSVPVNMHIEVTRFHALTEKARYTVGGWHSVQFNVTLQDARTGAPLTAPTLVKADFKAYGGARAIEAEQKGVTQKVRITQRVASVIQQILLDPAGNEVAQLSMPGPLEQL